MSASKFTVEDLAIKKLDESTDLTCFDCTKGDELGLNEFLHKEAMKYQRELLGVTHLFCLDEEIVGYVTLAMGSINVKATRLRIESYDEKRRYPALLLGRLAVANKFRKLGVGKHMCLWSIGFARKLSSQVGCRFVTLLTKSEFRIEFYEKCGFQVCSLEHKKKEKKDSSTEEEEYKLMYFPLPINDRSRV